MADVVEVWERRENALFLALAIGPKSNEDQGGSGVVGEPDELLSLAMVEEIGVKDHKLKVGIGLKVGIIWE